MNHAEQQPHHSTPEQNPGAEIRKEVEGLTHLRDQMSGKNQDEFNQLVNARINFYNTLNQPFLKAKFEEALQLVADLDSPEAKQMLGDWHKRLAKSDLSKFAQSYVAKYLNTSHR